MAKVIIRIAGRSLYGETHIDPPEIELMVEEFKDSAPMAEVMQLLEEISSLGAIGGRREALQRRSAEGGVSDARQEHGTSAPLSWRGHLALQ